MHGRGPRGSAQPRGTTFAVAGHHYAIVVLTGWSQAP